MRTLSDILLGASLPTLTVHVPGKSEDPTFLVQHGMTIGRDSDNAIVVDHCDVCAVHAGIYHGDDSDALRIHCVQDDFSLTNQYGNDINAWPLNEGLIFWIGQVRFVCGCITIGAPATERDEVPVNFAARVEPQAVLSWVPPLRVSCPRCHQSMLTIAASAKFCPHCGLELPENCPPWNGDGELNLSNPALAAYAHALFNLGVRYENVAGGTDLEQATRYYEKAARIGVLAAKSRLEAREIGG